MIQHDPALRQKALALFEEGHSYRAVSTILGLSPYTVREWFYLFSREKGNELACEVPSQALKDEAFALFESGLGYRAASKKLNISSYTVRSWYRTYLRTRDTDRGERQSSSDSLSQPLYPATLNPVFQHFLSQAAKRDQGDGREILVVLHDIVLMVGMSLVAHELLLDEQVLAQNLSSDEMASFELVFKVLKLLQLHL